MYIKEKKENYSSIHLIMLKNKTQAEKSQK